MVFADELVGDREIGAEETGRASLVVAAVADANDAKQLRRLRSVWVAHSDGVDAELTKAGAVARRKEMKNGMSS